MKRHLTPLLLALLALTACTATPPGASGTSTASATTTAPTPTATEDEAFLAELRRKARTLTPEVADDEALLTLGEMGCKSANDEKLRQTYMLNATLTMGYTDDEARIAFQTGERYLC